MKIRVVFFSKDKDKGIKELEAHYRKLNLPFLSNLEIVCLKREENSKAIPVVSAIKIEEKEFLKYLSSDYFNIALDASGKSYSSLEFASCLETWRDQSKSLCFFIGGAFGLGEDILAKCDLCLSLSKMTFPHDLARIILLEQIYRSFTIINHKKYNY